MSGSRRIVLGHAVMRLGLAVRRLSLPLCALAAAGLAAWTAFHVVVGRGQGWPRLIPLDLGAHAGLAIWVVEAVATVVVLLLGLRLLAIAVGAFGWLLLPPHHRELLGRFTEPPPGSPRDGSQREGSPHAGPPRENELDLCRASDGASRRPARSRTA